MKHFSVFVTAVIFLAGIILSGCDSPALTMEKTEISEKEADRELEIVSSEVEAELKDYRESNSDRLREYNRILGNIKQSIINESDMEARVKFVNELDKVEATHRDLKHEMAAYKASGEENWDEFKDSFSSRMDNLGESLDDFFSTTETFITQRNQP